MKKLQKFALSAIFISALTLGFASCSDDKNEDNDPKPSTNKLLPKRLTISDDIDGVYIDYHYTYNDKNELVSYRDEQSTGDEAGEQIIKYDAQRRVVGIEDHSFLFTFLNETTIQFKASEGDPNETITLNDKGLIIKSIDTDNRVTEYTYDENKNILKMSNIGSFDHNYTYHKEYSPFCNMNIPSYFMMYDDFWGIQTTGLHMTDTDEANLTGNETYNYKILESKDNYPTKLESIVTYIYDGEKEESREIFTIEYQEMK